MSRLSTASLTDLQEHLIEANLRRRHKFLRAQENFKAQEETHTKQEETSRNTDTTGSMGAKDPIGTKAKVQDSTSTLIVERGKHTTSMVLGVSQASTAERAFEYSTTAK